jgi:hypothetical protein
MRRSRDRAAAHARKLILTLADLLDNCPPMALAIDDLRLGCLP